MRVDTDECALVESRIATENPERMGLAVAPRNQFVGWAGDREYEYVLCSCIQCIRLHWVKIASSDVKMQPIE